MQPFSVLIVDDEELFLKAVSRDLLPLGVGVHSTTSAADALTLLEQYRPAVVLSDIRMPGMSGIDLLGEIKRVDPTTAVVMISGTAHATEAVTALKLGAFDYVEKPYTDAAELREVLAKAAAAALVERGTSASSPRLLGESAAMRRVRTAIDTVARTDATVLIVGESGTGKELAARAIHDRSRRATKPFVAVNCAAISESLLESELFGHERGAFTGAATSRRGLFEAAQGGTIFLDEIGHVSPGVQTSLLRVLQEREIRRVGASESTKVDVRVVAATNANLSRLITEGRFRLDLYYRLNVIELQLPPLRRREGDVLLIAEHLLHRFAKELGKQAVSFSAEAMHVLEAHRWPGNVRELENIVYRAVLGSSGRTVERIDLEREQTPLQALTDVPPLSTGNYSAQRRDLVQHFEQRYLELLLARTGGNLSQAARLSGIDRSNLRRMLREHGLRPMAVHSESERAS
ncbi:MAG: sigma-54-dependent Fis family transcriptional regulator [Deltaproteobacteria bacterium]|nr:sigma-54-dependent Fis family transcriptional regulator [Deltaproteobacteria bacterium]